VRKRVDIYKKDIALQRKIDSIKNSELSKRNKSTILNFADNCFADGLSMHRVLFYLGHLERVAKWLKKDFEEASKEDIISLLKSIEGMDYSDWSKMNYRIVLKRFYKWAAGGDEYPDTVKWVRTTRKNLNHTLPEELLTEEDIAGLIDAASHPRDKALIFVLYESGCRIGELCSLQLKHVEFDKYGAVLLVEGKTGQRRIRIISSTPQLATWMDVHPLKDKRGSPLWVGIGTRGKNEQIDYASIRALIRRAAKKAGITKRLNPHIFRHSRATHLASALTEAQMNEYFGWVQGSSMPSTYVHLSGRDVDDALLRIHGMKEEKEEKVKLKPKTCVRCGQLNSSVSKFCTKCGAVLDIQTALDLEEEMEEIDNQLTDLLQDEKVQDFLIKRMKEIGIG
jgi:integrase